MGLRPMAVKNHKLDAARLICWRTLGAEAAGPPSIADETPIESRFHGGQDPFKNNPPQRLSCIW